MDFAAPSPPVDFAGLADLSVEDEDGAPVPFKTLYEHQPTIIVFVRHFL